MTTKLFCKYIKIYDLYYFATQRISEKYISNVKAFNFSCSLSFILFVTAVSPAGTEFRLLILLSCNWWQLLYTI